MAAAPQSAYRRILTAPHVFALLLAAGLPALWLPLALLRRELLHRAVAAGKTAED